MQTILVVEDQKDLRELLQRCLANAGFDVIVAGDGLTGLRIAQDHRPDLLLLDLTLPGMDGLELCRKLRSHPQAGRVPIIVLSARGSEADRVLGLEIGADDYLAKPFSSRELVARVKAVLRRMGRNTQSPVVLRFGELQIDAARHEVVWRDQRVDLRRSEFRVLQFLTTEPGRVFSRDEIIDAVNAGDTAVTERTVDVHITKLRQKLGDGGRHIETVRGVGYRFISDP